MLNLLFLNLEIPEGKFGGITYATSPTLAQTSHFGQVADTTLE